MSMATTPDGDRMLVNAACDGLCNISLGWWIGGKGKARVLGLVVVE